MDYFLKVLSRFLPFGNLNRIKRFDRTTLVVFLAIIMLIAGFFIAFSKNHQNIISEEVKSLPKEKIVAEADVFLKKSDRNLAIADKTTGNSIQRYAGEGGGLEGIMEDTLIDGTNLINVHSGDLVLSRSRNEIVAYEVQTGDTLGSIAGYFGVSLETILWANKLTSRSVIRPGMKLEILPVTGIKHSIKKGETLNSIAAYYKSDIDKIIEINDLPADGRIVAGKNVIVPDGKMPARAVASYGASSLARKYGTTPDAPSLVSAPVDVGYFIYPTTGRNWGLIHGFNGVDIANNCGTQVFAAADGDVIGGASSGWNGGYGKFLKIRHPNGIITLYAHLSKLLVSTGETLSKGQVIGLIGSTGRSTGCHLHWEVRGATNPLGKR